MIDLVTNKRPHNLGGGFGVGRVLPLVKRRMVGPSISLDQVGRVDLARGTPGALDVRPHPQIGLATVTKGRITHRDTLGCVATGSAEVGDQAWQTGQMAVVSPGVVVCVTAAEPAAIMMPGGKPLGERHMLWNVASSSKARLQQAPADWVAGRMKLPAADGCQFTPLPPGYAARTMQEPGSRAIERGKAKEWQTI